MFGGLAANVVVLGFVSMLTDVSSEMIYPLLPLFLTSVLGAGPAFLGVIEGIAEATASLFKLVSGMLSDRVGRRKSLVLGGYSLSSLSRPLIALATSPLAVLVIRFSDRLGKGIRTSPRDALIADSVDASSWGRAYGFHRSMDHAGAIIGPLIASLLLGVAGFGLRTVFWLAAIPGIFAVVVIVFRVQEVKRRASANGTFLTALPRGRLRTFLSILFLFTLGNSTDAFLLLRASRLGVTPAVIPLLWMVFHLVKMGSSMPFGLLSDRIGRRGVIVAGWTIYALSYLGFASATTERQIWLLFMLYGLYYGLTEGVEKAFIADMVAGQERGGAFGWYHCVIGIGTLPASIMFGLIWEHAGMHAAFLTGAALAAVASVLLLAGMGSLRRG